MNVPRETVDIGMWACVLIIALAIGFTAGTWLAVDYARDHPNCVLIGETP